MVFVTERKPSDYVADLEDADLDELIASALANSGEPPPPALGRERLLRSVAEMPERYAPFFSRLGRMWSLNEVEVEAALREAARRGWRRAWSGIRYMNIVAGGKLGNANARLLCFQASVRFPVHRHQGEEEVLVLEGSYTDSAGKVVAAGDAQVMGAGSEHALVINPGGPCVAAVVQRGLSFTAPWLKRVSHFLAG